MQSQKSQHELKMEVARTALRYVPEDAIIGVGTGSTVNCFIDALVSAMKHKIRGAVASSQASANRLTAAGIEVYDLNSVDELPVYVDGADEVNRARQMLKGGGGALTREKIVGAVARQFVCIVDASKVVGVLGKFPLPLEVIPMARSYVAREVVKLGGSPVYRQGFVTDNGNVILDVWNMEITAPEKLEQQLNNITGVVTNGIFALRPADVVLVAGENGVGEIN